MKSSAELEIALAGLRTAARGKLAQVDFPNDFWVDQALTRNYWRHLCERSQNAPAPRHPRRPRSVGQALAENAA